MCRVLTRCDGAVMTTGTGTDDFIVIHSDRRHPGAGRQQSPCARYGDR
jgi:hypothetical protein